MLNVLFHFQMSNMSPQKLTVESGALEVRFVGDNDVLDHIVEKHEGIKSNQAFSCRFLLCIYL